MLLAFLIAGPAFAADKAVAVFDFELIDSSLEGSMMGENPAQQARLETMAPKLRAAIDGLDGYAIVDIAPVRDKALSHHLESCGNCALSFAREVGAAVAVTGSVQKVSNLILNINAYAFDVETGRPLARGSTDIRSNSDESWQRGIDYLWDNVLRAQLEDAR